MAISEQQLQSHPKKAYLGKQVVAAVIDGALCGVVRWISFIGWIASGVYVLVRDGLEFEFADLRSIGKKLTKLWPVRLDGRPMDIMTSITRNLVLVIGVVGAVFWVAPFVGWLIFEMLAILGAAMAPFEFVLVIRDPDGRRFGDKLAGTKVTEVAD